MARRFTEKIRFRKLRPATGKSRASQIGVLRPFAAVVAVFGLIALVIVGIRTLAGHRRQAETPIEPPPPPPPRQAPPQPRRRGLLGLGMRHPLVISLIVVVVVVIGTLVYLPFAERTTTIGGIRHEPSEYDEFFTYSQMEAMTHFAMCDAMLFSTRPEEELENVKERMAIEVEFDSSVGAGAPSQAGQYNRRVRSPEEIAEAIRLAEEFYERVNCQ